MKKLYLFTIVAVFSFVFIGSEANNSSINFVGKSSCPYLNQIHKNHGSTVCPYMERQDKCSGTECPYQDKMKNGSESECPYMNKKSGNANVTHVMQFVGT